MAWNQDLQDPPRRSGYDLYLDGLVTGGVTTWLLMMLYELVNREHRGVSGIVAISIVILFLAGVTLFKVLQLWKRGD